MTIVTGPGIYRDLAVRAGERRIHRAHVETGVRAERGHCPLCDGLPITWDGGQ